MIESVPSRPAIRRCTLHVCTSCRSPADPREPREGRPGFRFFQELRDALDRSELKQRVEVRPAECLSICPRPCGIALSSPGAWTYLFGDQQLGQSVDDVLACIALYLESLDGFMARAQRPLTLRASILGRVPPLPEQRSCT